MTTTTAPRKVSATVVARRLAKSVDRLARLHAVISRAQAEAELLKAGLKASGFEVINGTHHKAVISTSEVVRFDSATAKSMLTPKQIAACTKSATRTAVSLYDL